MGTKMKKVSLLVLCVGLFAGCQDLDNLQPVETKAGSSEQSNVISVSGVEPVSPYEWNVTFDNPLYAQRVSDLSNFIVNGNVVILSVLTPDVTNCILYVSNQRPGERATLTVPERYYTSFIVYTNYLVVNTNGVVVTNERIFTNTSTLCLDGGKFEVKTYGSDDTQPPTLEILSPHDGFVFNKFIFGDSPIQFLFFDDDNFGIESRYLMIDNNPKTELAQDDTFTIYPSCLGAGTHKITVMVKDYGGNVSSDSIDLVIDLIPPTLAAYPNNNILITGSCSNDITLNAYNSDSSTIAVYAEITTCSNTYTIPFTGGPNSWTTTYYPTVWDSDTNKVRYLFVNASFITNAIDTAFIYHEKGVKYVSASRGDDTWLGTIYHPVKTVGAALQKLAVSASSWTVKLTAGNYPSVSLSSCTKFNIIGGYSSDYQQVSYTAYSSTIGGLNLSGCTSVTVSNFTMSGQVSLDSCDTVKLVNIFSTYSTSDAKMKMLNSSHCVISNCVFNYGTRGAYIDDGAKNLITRSDFSHNSYITAQTVSYYGAGLYLSGDSNTVSYCTFNYNTINLTYNATTAGWGIIWLTEICSAWSDQDEWSSYPKHILNKGYGGGIYLYGKWNALTGCSFTCNQAISYESYYKQTTAGTLVGATTGLITAMLTFGTVCTFVTEYAPYSVPTGLGGGADVYYGGSDCVVSGCTYSGNYANKKDSDIHIGN